MSLILDFYESGIGETILITFPDGSKGIVDAHPSQTGVIRVLDENPDLDLEFVCLTHPHEDHGAGLIPILKKNKVKEFWHTVSGIQAWVYASGEAPSYPSPFRETVDEYMKKTGKFILGVFGPAYERKMVIRNIHSAYQSQQIGGVKIHFLGPEEEEQNKALVAYGELAQGNRKTPPDPNSISAIIAIEYNGSVVIFGGDALISNWVSAHKVWRKLNLQKAKLIKIPHHGASNAFDLKGRRSYLDLVEKDAYGVLFAGDSKHPDPRVLEKLEGGLNLHCLVNGCRHSRKVASAVNPLAIKIPGARSAKVNLPFCQYKISVEVNSNGDCDLAVGDNCSACALSKL